MRGYIYKKSLIEYNAKLDYKHFIIQFTVMLLYKERYLHNNALGRGFLFLQMFSTFLSSFHGNSNGFIKDMA